ncbi:hypothetical protein EV363DRAFT_1168131, partial [Boletus edulis]
VWCALSFYIFRLLPAFVFSDRQHSPLVHLSSPSTVKSCTLPTVLDDYPASIDTNSWSTSSELYWFLRRLSYVYCHPTSNMMSSLLSCLRASATLQRLPFDNIHDCQVCPN